MSVYVYPPTAAPAGIATEATLADIKTEVTEINAKTGASFFTLPYDEMDVDESGALTDVYTTKLATVTQQTMTITYSSATKQSITNIKVV
jgi:hypothetical protein